MQVTETLNEGLKREFRIVLPAGDIERQIEARLKEFGQTARVPGFRPGKVPLGLLKSRYGDAFRGEVLQQAVTDGSSKTIAEKGLRPALQPRVEITSADPGADLAFTVAVEILPEIAPMDFRALEIERLDVAVADADVDKELERRAEGVKRSEPVSPPRPAAEGDIAVLDFAGTVDGVAIQGGSAQGFHLELGGGSFIPGFDGQLAGAALGDKRTVKVRFPDDYANANLKGKDAVFEVEIKEIRAPKAAAVDDELAKGFGHETLAAMKEAARKELESAYSMVARSRLKRALFDKLTDAHDFPLPLGMVEMEFEGIWRQVEDDRKAGRLDDDDKAKSEDDLKAEYRAIAERRVRLGLLLSEVGRANNIQVGAEEVNRALMAEARRYPGSERQVIEYYRKNPSAAEALRAPLIEDKVVDFILEMAKVERRRVTAEEFGKAGVADAPALAKREPAKSKARAKAKDEAESEDKAQGPGG